MLWALYTLLRLLVLRIVLLYYGHPPAPPTDALMAPAQQLHKLTHEVAALRQEITGTWGHTKEGRKGTEDCSAEAGGS